MQNTTILRHGCTALALAAGSAAPAIARSPAAVGQPPAGKPNVVVFFTDDHGWADLGIQGILEDIRTPNVDMLARNGVLAMDGYATAPQCVPSRAGIMTSIYQNKFGLELNPDPKDGFDATTTIPQRLQQAGYVTGMSGKWHLGPNHEIGRHGFGWFHHKHSNVPGMGNYNPQTGERRPVGPFPSEVYHIDEVSDAAVTFIEQNADKPFFFYAAYRAPHTPMDATPEYLARFPRDMPEKRRHALGMISAIDDGVGRVMETLREHGLEENTLVFYIGDNGAPLKMHMKDDSDVHGWDGSINLPMNGEKGMLAEGGIRVPFVVYWKGVIPPGTVYRHPITALDVGATALSIAGLEVPPELDGKDILPYLRGEITTRPHESIYWRWLGQAAIRKGPWKYLRAGDTHQYLFNLEDDPGELNNLIAEEPGLAAELMEELRQWADQLPKPGLPASVPERHSVYYRFYLEGEKHLRFGEPPPPRPAQAQALPGAVVRPEAPARPRQAQQARQDGPNLSLDERLKRFQRRDANGDGVVTLEEWIAGRESELDEAQMRTVIRTFESLDLDGDGVWTMEEARGAQAGN